MVVLAADFYREEKSALPILTRRVFENVLFVLLICGHRSNLSCNQATPQAPPHFVGGLSCCWAYSADVFHAKRLGQNLSTQA